MHKVLEPYRAELQTWSALFPDHFAVFFGPKGAGKDFWGKVLEEEADFLTISLSNVSLEHELVQMADPYRGRPGIREAAAHARESEPAIFMAQSYRRYIEQRNRLGNQAKKDLCITGHLTRAEAELVRGLGMLSHNDVKLIFLHAPAGVRLRRTGERDKGLPWEEDAGEWERQDEIERFGLAGDNTPEDEIMSIELPGVASIDTAQPVEQVRLQLSQVIGITALRAS